MAQAAKPEPKAPANSKEAAAAHPAPQAPQPKPVFTDYASI